MIGYEFVHHKIVLAAKQQTLYFYIMDLHPRTRPWFVWLHMSSWHPCCGMPTDCFRRAI